MSQVELATLHLPAIIRASHSYFNSTAAQGLSLRIMEMPIFARWVRSRPLEAKEALSEILDALVMASTCLARASDNPFNMDPATSVVVRHSAASLPFYF